MNLDSIFNVPQTSLQLSFQENDIIITTTNKTPVEINEENNTENTGWHLNFVFPQERVSKIVKKELETLREMLKVDKNLKLGHSSKLELVKIVADEMLEYTL